MARRSKRIYPELAAKYGVLLYPFFLDGVAGRSRPRPARRPASQRRRRRRDRRAHICRRSRNSIAQVRSAASVVRVACARAITRMLRRLRFAIRRVSDRCVMPRLFTGLEIPPAGRPIARHDARRLARGALDRSGELSPDAALHRRHRRCAGARYRRPARAACSAAVRAAARRAHLVRRPQAARGGRRGRRRSRR